ncbi:hypothetical protein AX16_001355 [Volvariella volvacea WC 439]|nr:hypothetical protein AX16_001355 [Volvariella volvacea WC 439]
MDSPESYFNTIDENVCKSKLSVSLLTYFDKRVDSHLTLTTVQPLPGLVPMLLHNHLISHFLRKIEHSPSAGQLLSQTVAKEPTWLYINASLRYYSIPICSQTYPL